MEERAGDKDTCQSLEQLIIRKRNPVAAPGTPLPFFLPVNHSYWRTACEKKRYC